MSIMNTTLGLGILNNTLRIAIECGALSLWFEPEPSGDGIAWHGWPAWDFANLKSRLGLEYKVVTDLPEMRDNLYPDMLALVDGEADVSIDNWGVNYARSKLVDFSYPQSFSGVYIFSGATKMIGHADLVMGVYDDHSFWLLNLAVVAQILMSCLLLKKENAEHSSFTSAVYVFGNVLYQPLNLKIIPKQSLGKAIMTLFTFYNFTLNLMYMSIIISLLVSGTPPPEINSLADLNKEVFRDVRIIMKRRSFVPQVLNSSGMLDGYEHRIDYIDAHEGGDTIGNIRDGSHVFITTYGSFYGFLCRTNRHANKAVGKLEDFRKSKQGFSASTSILDCKRLFFSEILYLIQEMHL